MKFNRKLLRWGPAVLNVIAAIIRWFDN